MMTLYFTPGACSIGIHLLLERTGLAYERRRVDIRAGENREPWFTALNPKAKVPVLRRDDGCVLTEFPVIARYLAAAAPEAGLLPTDPEHRLRADELTEYLVATLHMQGFSRIFRPAKFVEDPAGHEAVRAQGRAIVQDGLAIVERQIGPGGPLADIRTVADAALFYILFWTIDRAGLTAPPSCARLYAELRASEAAERVFAAEGITP
ncbi:glutathione S-transferase family protein [Methylobacterium aquaticum]|jgi:glutathione S-transferase|uniref:GST N-terminal domain-containing protein n=1 Tax=Methylobacterium aquaticum TaxID=270351 RepID=A0A0J6SAI8_9HYPH|nr:glutathione S-transferase [Methylobacterium aquaticum]KMO32235.1 hypothetical protein VP06_18130 [Methylobacterium aquaticum]